MQQQMLDKHIRFYSIDAYQVAQDAQMGKRINTIMQTCFFALSEVLPREQAIGAIKHATATRKPQMVANNDETKANPYPNLPDILKLQSGEPMVQNYSAVTLVKVSRTSPVREPIIGWRATT